MLAEAKFCFSILLTKKRPVSFLLGQLAPSVQFSQVYQLASNVQISLPERSRVLVLPVKQGNVHYFSYQILTYRYQKTFRRENLQRRKNDTNPQASAATLSTETLKIFDFSSKMPHLSIKGHLASNGASTFQHSTIGNKLEPSVTHSLRADVPLWVPRRRLWRVTHGTRRALRLCNQVHTGCGTRCILSKAMEASS